MQHEKPLKIHLPQVEQVQHLLMLGLGNIPGFKPTDETMLPLKAIQYAYLNHYGLNDYAPIIMTPDYFNLNQVNNPIYYSLNYQTSYLMSPKDNQLKTMAKEFQGIHWVLGKICDLILSKKFISSEAKLYINGVRRLCVCGALPSLTALLKASIVK